MKLQPKQPANPLEDRKRFGGFMASEMRNIPPIEGDELERPPLRGEFAGLLGSMDEYSARILEEMLRLGIKPEESYQMPMPYEELPPPIAQPRYRPYLPGK